MSKIIPYLFRRGNKFYFRIAIPSDLRDTFHNREVIQSLKTEKRSEAIPRALELAAKTIKIFNDAKLTMDIKTKRRLYAKDEKLKIKEMLHQEELVQREWQYTAELRQATADAAIKAENELLRQIVLAGGQSKNSPVTAEHEPVKGGSSSKAPMLSSVFDEYVKSYKGQGSRDGEANLCKIEAFGKLFIDFVGDKKIDGISQKEVSQFFKHLINYPGGRGGLSAKIMQMSFLERIEHAQRTNCVRIAPKTYEANYLSPANLFFRWLNVNHEDYAPAIKFDHIDYTKYGGQRDKGEDKQRSLRVEEIKRLMYSQMMISCSGNFRKQHQYWLPMIALFTGARVNEICQLNPQHDIRKDELTGLWFFDFTEETPGGEGVEKSHKNDPSKRRVPVHSMLLKCGFEDYLKKIKAAGHDRIFNGWKPKGGKASYYAEEFFRDYLRDVGLRDDTLKKKVTGMHCLRSTFISHTVKRMMEGGFSYNKALTEIRPIVGHIGYVADENGKSLSVTDDYVDKDIVVELMWDLEVLSAIVEKLDYGIEFPVPK